MYRDATAPIAIICMVIILQLVAGQSKAFEPGNGTGQCPYDKGGFKGLDGCDQAPGGDFQRPHFFTEARQSEQRQYFDDRGRQSDHPVPFNVACVDYSCGLNLEQLGPDHRLKDPQIDALPKGCLWDGASHTVSCNSGGPWTFNGWDMGSHGGWTISLNQSTPTSATLKNMKFTDGAFVDQQGLIRGNGIVRTAANSCVDLTITQSEFFRSMRDYSHPVWDYFIYQAANGTCKPSLTVTYSVLEGVHQHAIRSNSSGEYIARFNYIYDFGGCIQPPNNGCAHASAVNIEGNQSGVGPQIIEFNVVLFGKDSISGTANISGFIQSAPATISKLSVNHNILISNKNSDYGDRATSGYLFETLPQGDNLGTLNLLEVNGNYMDPTGSFGCLRRANGSMGNRVVNAISVGNIDLLDGREYNLDEPCYGRSH